MSKKRRDRHKKGHQEPKFDFDEAKDLTVGQVIRKNEEVEAGVLPEDSILDKYIKQHREEIEADKFETRQFKKEELASTQSLEDMIQEVRTDAAKKIDRELELDIMGCDIDARMVEIAKANAQAAGVAGDITFKQMRVQDLRSDKVNGVIISNPPYGERLSDDAGVTKLYAEMGQVFAPLKTWSKFILTSDEAFESKYGSPADKKRKLYNGTLKVNLYQYFGQRVKRQELK